MRARAVCASNDRRKADALIPLQIKLENEMREAEFTPLGQGQICSGASLDSAVALGDGTARDGWSTALSVRDVVSCGRSGRADASGGRNS